MTSAAKPRINFDFEAIGTSWHISLAAPYHTARSVSKIIADRIELFDRTYSRFRADSWVTHIGNNPGKHKTPSDFAPMFRFYQKLYNLSDGLFTPLIGDAMERAGYDAQYSLAPRQLKAIPNLEQALTLKSNTLHVKYNCVLDFGAAGKGYLVDLIATLLRQQGITEYLIDAGGDILAHSPAPTPVILEDPQNLGKSLGTVYLHNQSIGASASNRRNWGKFHHIINPKTLQSVSDMQATWVITDSAMLADGLATCLFFVPPTKLLSAFSFDYMMVHNLHKVRVSKGFMVQDTSPGKKAYTKKQ